MESPPTDPSYAPPPSEDSLAPAAGPAHPPAKEAVSTLLRSFSDRAWGVLLAPFQTFRHHDPSWGWGQAWGFVALVGILVGILGLVRVDHERVGNWTWERATANMNKAQRAQVDNPEVAEMMAKSRRVQAFLGKLSSVLGPPLLGLIGLVFGAAFLYVVSMVFSKEPPDPIRCLSVAAFVSLANLIDLCGSGMANLLANALPRPNLSAFVDPFTQPLLTAVLGRLSPGLMAYYLLLTAGLEGSLGLTRRRAIAVSVVTFLVVTLIMVGLGGLSKLQQGGAS